MTTAVYSQQQVKFEKGLGKDYLREKEQVCQGAPVWGGGGGFIF